MGERLTDERLAEIEDLLRVGDRGVLYDVVDGEQANHRPALGYRQEAIRDLLGHIVALQAELDEAKQANEEHPYFALLVASRERGEAAEEALRLERQRIRELAVLFHVPDGGRYLNDWKERASIAEAERAQTTALREALAFYADRANYEGAWTADGLTALLSHVEGDGGRLAQRALAGSPGPAGEGVRLTREQAEQIAGALRIAYRGGEEYVADVNDNALCLVCRTWSHGSENNHAARCPGAQFDFNSKSTALLSPAPAEREDT